jgi:hypothetical protein
MQTRAAIQSLQRGGAQRYVLDLRSNGGGLFPAGVEVGRMWINRGDIVLIADRQAHLRAWCWVGCWVVCCSPSFLGRRGSPRPPAPEQLLLCAVLCCAVLRARPPHPPPAPLPTRPSTPTSCSTGVRDVYEADGSALETAAPLTVLANRGTASAAEASQPRRAVAPGLDSSKPPP